MKQKFTLISFLGAAALILLSSAHYMNYNPDGKIGFNGSPGEQTCGKSTCHDSFALNSGSGSVSVTVVGAESGFFVPGQQYTVEVTVAQSSAVLFGFGCEALLSSGANAGTLTAGSGSHTGNATVSGNSRRTVTQNENSGLASGSKTWSFTWTAPAAADDVVFYVVGNAANNASGENGDYIYTTSVSLSPVVGVLEVDVENIELSVYPNPTSDEIQLQYQLQRAGEVEVEIYNVSGGLVKSFGKNGKPAGSNLEKISLVDLSSGSYCVQMRLDGKLMASRLVRKH